MHEEIRKVRAYTDIHLVSYVVTAAYPSIGIFFCVSTRWCDNRDSLGHDTYETRVFVADGQQYRQACVDFNEVEHHGPSVYNMSLQSSYQASERHNEICELLSLGELKLRSE